MLQGLISAIKGNSEKDILSQLEILIKREPSNGHHYLRLGDFFVKKNQISEATKYYLKAAKLFYKQGFIKKAIVAIKIALRYDSQNQTVIQLAEKIEKELITNKDKASPETPQRELHLSIFERLCSEQIKQLINKANEKVFKKNEYIIIEGDVGDTLFIIQQGRVKVITSFAGRTIELAELGAGDIIGEVSLLTSRPRTASVIALEDTVCYEISKPIIMEILDKSPEIADSLVELYHKRAKDTLEKVKRTLK